MESELPEYVWFSERSKRTTLKRQRKAIPQVHERNAALSSRGGNAFRHTKTGFRPSLGHICRSGWESNICHVLKAFDIPYEYEPEIFTFPVRRGTRGYTPDIRIGNEWVEIKGYFDKASQIKIKRFRIHYPEEFSRLTMIVGRSGAKIAQSLGVPTILVYEDIKKIFQPKITNWEN